MRSCFGMIAALVGSTMLAGSAAADWPEEPTAIRMVLGTGTGGATDTAARTVAPYLEKYLGENATITVVNMPGAGGEIGFTEIAKSTPDGTTIGLAAMPNLVTRVVEKNPPNYTIDDLTYLGYLDTTPGAIVVPTDSPFNTLGEFVAFAKENPGVATVAVGSIAADNHLVMLQFMRDHDVQFTIIPFGGDDTSRNAIMGGHVTAGSVSALNSQTYAELLKTLAVTSEERLSFLPDVPTAREEGFDAVGGSSRGFIAPAGLPDDVREAWIAAVEKAVNDPEFVEDLANVNITASFKNAADYEAYIREQYEAMSALFQETPWIQ